VEAVPVVRGERFAVNDPRSTLPSLPPGTQSLEPPWAFRVLMYTCRISIVI
jgi:hypothetical protein